MEKGFYSTAVLLAAILLIFVQLTANNNIETKYRGLNTALLQMEKISFTRTEAEIYIDNVIVDSLLRSPAPLESNLLKEQTNKKILGSLKQIGILKIFVCKRTAQGNYAPAQEEIGLEQLNGISRVLSVKYMQATIVQYTLTGGIEANKTLCGIIQGGEAETHFVIPIGFTVTVERL